MKLDRLYRKKVLILPKDAPAFEAARAMSERFVGCVLVSDRHGHIVGIVTDRDIACGVVGERLSPDTPIQEIMAPTPHFVFEGAPLDEVIDLMRRYGIRRVPVIRESGSGSQHCVGIYTLDDIVASGQISPEDLASIVKQQMRITPPRVLLRERRETKKEHTLDRFNKIITQSMGVDRRMAEEISFYLLKSIIRRISAPVAAHFIAELPSLLQEEFLDLPAGPDREISLHNIEATLLRRYELDESGLGEILHGFWRGLELATKGGISRHVFANLPYDLQQAFAKGRLAA